jgi:hypothetical protein
MAISFISVCRWLVGSWPESDDRGPSAYALARPVVYSLLRKVEEGGSPPPAEEVLDLGGIGRATLTSILNDLKRVLRPE